MFRGALLFVTFGALGVGKWCFPSSSFFFFSFSMRIWLWKAFVMEHGVNHICESLEMHRTGRLSRPKLLSSVCRWGPLEGWLLSPSVEAYPFPFFFCHHEDSPSHELDNFSLLFGFMSSLWFYKKKMKEKVKISFNTVVEQLHMKPSQ